MFRALGRTRLHAEQLHSRHADGRRPKTREDDPTMPLKHPKANEHRSATIKPSPLFLLDTQEIPRDELRHSEMPPDVAYQLIHDELMLDGNARLNLATFVSTWMEPEAEKLMAECFDKNMKIGRAH